MGKMILDGTIQYFYSMNRPVNVAFDGTVEQDGETWNATCLHVERILERYVCTKKVGSTSQPQKVKITVEWE